MKKNKFLIINTGLVDYGKAYTLQKELLNRKIDGEENDFLILSEHLPAITAGRGFDERNLLVDRSRLKELGISLHTVERGGDATFHGPGQLVGYPVADLSRRGRDLRLFIYSLEEVIIRTLRDLGIESGREEGSAGVWTPAGKIASIGVAVRKWISYHGFALNIFTNLDNFSFINPCGMDYNVMTSVEKISRRRVALEDVGKRIEEHFSAVFDAPVALYSGGEIRNV